MSLAHPALRPCSRPDVNLRTLGLTPLTKVNLSQSRWKTKIDGNREQRSYTTTPKEDSCRSNGNSATGGSSSN